MLPCFFQAHHVVPRAMAYDSRHSVLVIAGDGCVPGVDSTLSVWQLDKEQMHLLGACGQPKVGVYAWHCALHGTL